MNGQPDFDNLDNELSADCFAGDVEDAGANLDESVQDGVEELPTGVYAVPQDDEFYGGTLSGNDSD